MAQVVGFGVSFAGVVSTLVTAAGGLRLAGDAVLDLWRREDGSVPGDRAAARQELLRMSELVKLWYEGLARSLTAGHEPPPPTGRHRRPGPRSDGTLGLRGQSLVHRAHGA